MKFIKYLSFFFLVSFVVSSCSESLEEINIDPTKLSDVELRLILPELLAQSAFNEGNNTGRVAGIIMKQILGLDAQQLAYNDYIIGEDAMNNYWRTGLYAGVLRSCQVVLDKTAVEDATFYSGVARIVMANEYGKAASFFGDIPLSQALKGLEVQQPAYDTQQDVYTAVQEMLDQAIRDLGSATGYLGGDLIYAGDAASWIGVANALKARFHMHLTKRNGDAATSALAALNGAFTSNADQPDFAFGTSETENYSLAKFGLERPSTLGIDSRFADLMAGKNDPRQAKYMEDAGGGNWLFHNAANADLIWAKNDAIIPYISYAEVKFLEAEALARTGGNASAALAAAITASMEQNGIAPADYADYVAANGSVEGLSQADAIQTIIEEAYVSYYGYAFHETWANYRRTGFPNLAPSPNASPGLDPSGVVPRRFLYVESETQTNSANVQAARDRQGGGGLLDVDVWAFE